MVSRRQAQNTEAIKDPYLRVKFTDGSVVDLQSLSNLGFNSFLTLAPVVGAARRLAPLVLKEIYILPFFKRKNPYTLPIFLVLFFWLGQA